MNLIIDLLDPMMLVTIDSIEWNAFILKWTITSIYRWRNCLLIDQFIGKYQWDYPRFQQQIYIVIFSSLGKLLFKTYKTSLSSSFNTSKRNFPCEYQSQFWGKIVVLSSLSEIEQTEKVTPCPTYVFNSISYVPIPNCTEKEYMP